MESENKSPFDNTNLNDYQKKQIKQEIDSAAFQKKVEEELQNEERFKNYFEGFNPASVKDFITSYARKKASWFRSGDFYIQQNEAEDLQWLNAAEQHLEYIQQKKLFDAQCLWRADKITMPGIEICFDFIVWERNIMSCPCIEPISETDVELYLQYLQQNNVDSDMRFFSDWQNYDLWKAEHEDEENGNLPEWYDFHNGRTGAGNYLLLPNMRGDKEEFYEKLAREKQRPEMEAKQAEWDKTRDKRPHVKSTYDKDFMDWFVATFEDKQTQEYYKARLRYNRNSGDKEHVNANIALLLKADEPISIEAHHDWKEAIERAVERYSIKKIAEFLPYAFERYQLNISMGVAQVDNTVAYKTMRQHSVELILEGREINGEPRDLNF
jgi:hypothetical protein